MLNWDDPTISMYISFFCIEFLPADGQKKAETRRRIATYLYILVSNYSATVDIYIVIYLTARNMENFK
jgi:hypothetical protein